MTIRDLRNNGYKVRVLHFRRHKSGPCIAGINFGCFEKDPKGGTTQVIIDSPTGEHFEGEAKCSNQDNYNKKLGVKIALGRSGVLNNKDEQTIF